MDSECPLMWASRRGDVEISSELLINGATVDLKNTSGRTSLMEAIIYKHRPQIDLLLKWGADPNLADSTEGRGPLHFAVLNDSEYIARELLSYGADITLRDKISKTPLDLCSNNKSLKEILLQPHPNKTPKPNTEEIQSRKIEQQQQELVRQQNDIAAKKEKKSMERTPSQTKIFDRTNNRSTDISDNMTKIFDGKYEEDKLDQQLKSRQVDQQRRAQQMQGISPQRSGQYMGVPTLSANENDFDNDQIKTMDTKGKLKSQNWEDRQEKSDKKKEDKKAQKEAKLQEKLVKKYNKQQAKKLDNTRKQKKGQEDSSASDSDEENPNEYKFDVPKLEKYQAPPEQVRRNSTGQQEQQNQEEPIDPFTIQKRAKSPQPGGINFMNPGFNKKTPSFKPFNPALNSNQSVDSTNADNPISVQKPSTPPPQINQQPQNRANFSSFGASPNNGFGNSNQNPRPQGHYFNNMSSGNLGAQNRSTTPTGMSMNGRYGQSPLANNSPNKPGFNQPMQNSSPYQNRSGPLFQYKPGFDPNQQPPQPNTPPNEPLFKYKPGFNQASNTGPPNNSSFNNVARNNSLNGNLQPVQNSQQSPSRMQPQQQPQIQPSPQTQAQNQPQPQLQPQAQLQQQPQPGSISGNGAYWNAAKQNGAQNHRYQNSTGSSDELEISMQAGKPSPGVNDGHLPNPGPNKSGLQGMQKINNNSRGLDLDVKNGQPNLGHLRQHSLDLEDEPPSTINDPMPYQSLEDSIQVEEAKLKALDKDLNMVRKMQASDSSERLNPLKEDQQLGNELNIGDLRIRDDPRVPPQRKSAEQKIKPQFEKEDNFDQSKALRGNSFKNSSDKNSLVRKNKIGNLEIEFDEPIPKISDVGNPQNSAGDFSGVSLKPGNEKGKVPFALTQENVQKSGELSKEIELEQKTPDRAISFATHMKFLDNPASNPTSKNPPIIVKSSTGNQSSPVNRSNKILNHLDNFEDINKDNDTVDGEIQPRSSTELQPRVSNELKKEPQQFGGFQTQLNTRDSSNENVNSSQPKLFNINQSRTPSNGPDLEQETPQFKKSALRSRISTESFKSDVSEEVSANSKVQNYLNNPANKISPTSNNKIMMHQASRSQQFMRPTQQQQRTQQTSQPRQQKPLSKQVLVRKMSSGNFYDSDQEIPQHIQRSFNSSQNGSNTGLSYRSNTPTQPQPITQQSQQQFLPKKSFDSVVYQNSEQNQGSQPMQQPQQYQQRSSTPSQAGNQQYVQPPQLKNSLNEPGYMRSSPIINNFNSVAANRSTPNLAQFRNSQDESLFGNEIEEVRNPSQYTTQSRPITPVDQGHINNPMVQYKMKPGFPDPRQNSVQSNFRSSIGLGGRSMTSQPNQFRTQASNQQLGTYRQNPVQDSSSYHMMQRRATTPAPNQLQASYMPQNMNGNLQTQQRSFTPQPQIQRSLTPPPGRVGMGAQSTVAPNYNRQAQPQTSYLNTQPSYANQQEASYNQPQNQLTQLYSQQLGPTYQAQNQVQSNYPTRANSSLLSYQAQSQVQTDPQQSSLYTTPSYTSRSQTPLQTYQSPYQQQTYQQKPQQNYSTTTDLYSAYRQQQPQSTYNNTTYGQTQSTYPSQYNTQTPYAGTQYGTTQQYGVQQQYGNQSAYQYPYQNANTGAYQRSRSYEYGQGSNYRQAAYGNSMQSQASYGANYGPYSTSTYNNQQYPNYGQTTYGNYGQYPQQYSNYGSYQQPQRSVSYAGGLYNSPYQQYAGYSTSGYTGYY